MHRFWCIVFGNQALHNLDLWQWIFGVPKRIRAFGAIGKYHNISVEDDVTIYGEYENWATATFITTTGDAFEKKLAKLCEGEKDIVKPPVASESAEALKER